MSSVFVSIASYCDSLLPQTIENALDNARFPDDLRFGVVEQSYTPYVNKISDAAKKHVRLITVDPKQSRGACWARALVMGLYENEDWFFQIDAHTIFDKYWDACLAAAWADCSKQSNKPYISGYPHPFEIKDGKPHKKLYTNNIIGNVVTKDKKFDGGLIDLPFCPIFIEKTTPINGFHLAAGCVFAPGSFVYEVPYDPHVYFYGEEALLALRAFTHGWDLFHVPKLPVYHYYDTGPDIEVKRVRHWSDEEDATRSQRWWEFNTRANQRMVDVIDGKNVGVYGLGTVRSLQDYVNFSGIDYKNRVIHPKAYVGPWHKE